MRSSANFLAVASWTFSFSLSAKFDFLSQPEAEELSVWLSRQDSLSSVLWKKSIQMLITQAMNSSEFIDVRRRQSTGSSKRHATPVVMLYPPRPNSEESEQYTWVGFLKVRLFIGTPLKAESRKDSKILKSSISFPLKAVQPLEDFALYKAW
jgi:hypothetical protein